VLLFRVREKAAAQDDKRSGKICLTNAGEIEIIRMRSCAEYKNALEKNTGRDIPDERCGGRK